MAKKDFRKRSSVYLSATILLWNLYRDLVYGCHFLSCV
jgi:hypothetical protein